MKQHQFTVEFNLKQYNCFYLTQMDTALKALSHLDSYDDLMGIDIETCAKEQYSYHKKAALSPHMGEIRLLQVCAGDEIFTFDIRKLKTFTPFIPFIESKKFVAHNAVFEKAYFKQNGVKNCNIGCSMLAAQLLIHAIYEDDSGRPMGLEPLIKQFFGITLSKILQVSDWGNEDLTFEQVQYATIDAVACLELGKKVGNGIGKLDLGRIYNLQKSVQDPVVDIHLNGMLFDVDTHEKLIEVWRNDLYLARNKVLQVTGLEKLTGHTMADWLTRNLDKSIISSWPTTASNKLSTDAKTLADYSYVPIVKPFLEYQKLEKMVSTYGPKLREHINPATNRIHSGLLIGRARTGRFASLSPNQQNYPRDKHFRSLFIAGADRDYICADYSQIEIRVAAEISRDPVMLTAYKNGEDIHGLTATALYGKTASMMSSDEWRVMRQGAKAVSLGLLFGLGAAKLGKYVRGMYPDIVFTEKQSLDNKNKWSEYYSGYKEWHFKVARHAKDFLMVTTAFGKKRKITEKEHYPVAANNPIQGTACEIMQSAMINLYNKKNPDLRLEASIHDELLVSIPKGSGKDYIPIVEECMVKGFLNCFPDGITNNLVEAHVGNNWSDAK